MEIKRKSWRMKQAADGESLVDLDSGDRVRKLRECERISSAGSPVCTCLTLARLLYERVMAAVAAAKDATESKIAVRLTVVCLVCRGRNIWSTAFCDSVTPLLLQRSLERMAGGISITWQLEVRPVETRFAFTAWQKSVTDTPKQPDIAESAFGKSLEGALMSLLQTAL